MDKWLKTGTLKRSASRTEIRTTDLATVDQQDDNHEVQRPTDCPVKQESYRKRKIHKSNFVVLVASGVLLGERECNC
ncbi:hypothetical protein AVEN_171191-1 [Araneus ventricosus]|uniref:Uncharacterized protein n=1 Tax=Araneus ventricosus TaxID=182803 RepID=A0A4Y2JD04_ARAVE|nr:hypothetical protein AVEN_171191-1 [Araneus ventricosus]